MSHRSEEDADRTACLVAIGQHLRIGKQILIVRRIDAGQLGCTVLLEQSADFGRETQTGLARKNGSDLFQSQLGFYRGGNIIQFFIRCFFCTYFLPVWFAFSVP